MKSKYWALLAGTALAATACSDPEVAPEVTRSNVVITATIGDEEAPASRTCVDMATLNQSVIGLLWSPGDSIGVFGKQGTSNALFRSTNTANAAKADFGGDMIDGDTPWRAYYPYNPANAGADATDLAGTVGAVQPFDMTTGRLTSDYKYGAPLRSNKSQFNFRHIFTLLQIDIDASATNLEGERLEYIELSAAGADGTPRDINGSFRFSAVDGSWSGLTNATSTTRMPWTDRPLLGSGSSYTGFMTVVPNIKAGDLLTLTIVTEGHRAQFTAPSKVDFAGGNAYCLPLTLQRFATDEYGWTSKELPSIKSFGFTVAANKGKLLDNKLVWNSSNNPEFRSVADYKAEVAASEISLEIPYLYDFNLVPEFTASEGATVTANGAVQRSGETAVDFSKPVVYTVSVGDDSRSYTVRVTNTGIPVVVINQSTSGDFSEDAKGFINRTVKNKFVDFMVRKKSSEWVTDDRMTVYNADGSVDMATATCGIRLRGNTSQDYPKKPFAIKMTSKQSVLGMPAHKRWVLLANWLDHSMIRNTVAFDVAHAVENAVSSAGIALGVPWNVHGRNVELVIDGHHVGNYYLCEQIKINKNRLNIQAAYEDVTNPTFETCGYLLELDNNYDENYKFTTSKLKLPFMFKDDLPNTEIFDKVKAKIQGIEDNLASGKYAEAFNDLDINSVIDQWLVWEATMNREFIEPRSVYYFMDGDGKLSAGPVWDFDRGTFQNTANAKSQGSDRVKPYNEWILYTTLGSGDKSFYSQWMTYLLKSDVFKATVQARWEVLYPALKNVENDIRRYGVELARSYSYDSAMWPTDKTSIQKHKSGFSDWSGDENLGTYEDVIENMVECYTKRIEGMNTLITTGKFTK